MMTMRQPETASLYERAEHAARFIRSRSNADVSIAIVLGSGLGGLADELANAVAIPYVDIPGFARATVEGHAGRLVIGDVGGVCIASRAQRHEF